jgi:uncharacterized membrane protein YfcA
MTLEIIIILLTIVLAVYFLFRPTSKKEKDSKEELRPKAKIIEKTFDKIKQNERRSRTIVE